MRKVSLSLLFIFFFGVVFLPLCFADSDYTADRLPSDVVFSRLNGNPSNLSYSFDSSTGWWKANVDLSDQSGFTRSVIAYIDFSDFFGDYYNPIARDFTIFCFSSSSVTRVNYIGVYSGSSVNSQLTLLSSDVIVSNDNSTSVSVFNFGSLLLTGDDERLRLTFDVFPEYFVIYRGDHSSDPIPMLGNIDLNPPRDDPFFTDIGSFFVWVFESLSSALSFVVASPGLCIIVLGFVIPGFCVGLFKRFRGA